jgi:CheY-like chemotaxis protein
MALKIGTDGIDQRELADVLAGSPPYFHTAANTMPGRRSPRSPPFDAILMDVNLPLKDGVTATLEIRRLGYQGPMIALTRAATPALRDQCFIAGCYDYLSKTCRGDTLRILHSGIISSDIGALRMVMDWSCLCNPFLEVDTGIHVSPVRSTRAPFFPVIAAGETGRKPDRFNSALLEHLRVMQMTRQHEDLLTITDKLPQGFDRGF